MNKYQEALDELNKWSLAFARWVIPYFKEDDMISLLMTKKETLQELVDIYPEYLELKERATPKKPIISALGCRCPMCETNVGDNNGWTQATIKFCQNCGQALDWGEQTTDSTHNELDNIFADSLEMLERLKIKK